MPGFTSIKSKLWSQSSKLQHPSFHVGFRLHRSPAPASSHPRPRNPIVGIQTSTPAPASSPLNPFNSSLEFRTRQRRLPPQRNPSFGIQSAGFRFQAFTPAKASSHPHPRNQRLVTASGSKFASNAHGAGGFLL